MCTRLKVYHRNVNTKGKNDPGSDCKLTKGQGRPSTYTKIIFSVCVVLHLFDSVFTYVDLL